MFRMFHLAGHDIVETNKQLDLLVVEGWVPISIQRFEKEPLNTLNSEPHVLVLCRRATPVYGNGDTPEGGPSRTYQVPS